MKADVKRELIETQKRLTLEAVYEAEQVRNEKLHESAAQAGLPLSRSPLGVDLFQIQSELYNPDNGIDLTDLSDTIVRDRLKRLEDDFKLSSRKTGRERVYITPETKAAAEDWKKQRNQETQDRKNRVLELSNDLGYTVEWLINAGYHRKRATAVVMQIDDLEALARHIDAVEDQ